MKKKFLDSWVELKVQVSEQTTITDRNDTETDMLWNCCFTMTYLARLVKVSARSERIFTDTWKDAAQFGIKISKKKLASFEYGIED